GFFPSKARTNTCADAAVGIEFNRPPVINSGQKVEIRDSSGELFDSVTSKIDEGAGYLSELTSRTTNGQSYESDVLYVVNNAVVFHPKSLLEYGKTYEVTVEEGMITDSSGTRFSVDSGWTFS